MADARRTWIKWIVLVTPCLCVSMVVCAQPNPATPRPLHAFQVQSPQTGSLSGRLTDLHSAPLEGMQVVLRNQATGAEVQAKTGKNGAFRFASLDAGEYTLEAEKPELGHGLLQGIVVTGGAEARMQVAMHFEPPAPALLEADAPNQNGAPARASPMPLVSRAPSAPARAAGLSMPIMAVPMLASASPSAAPRISAPPVSAPPAPMSASAAPNPQPIRPRPALSASSPVLTASIATEPLALEPLQPLPSSAALDSEDTIRGTIRGAVQPAAPTRTLPSSVTPPAASAVPPRTPPPSAPQPASHAPAPPQRAELETQSAAIQPTLAIALPRAFPLKAGFAPDLSASTAVAEGAQMLMRLKLPHLTPILAAVERVDPVTPAVATTVTATQLQALPVSGRRWQEFLLDTPATSASADSSQTSYRGSQESAEITIDGASTRLAFGVGAGSGSSFSSRASDQSSGAGEGAGQQSSLTQTWNRGRGLGVSEAAIREVTAVAGNVEAEASRSAGGRTSIQTESGGDELHGQAFLFDRQNTWGAQNPFTQRVQNTGTSASPVFTQAPFTPPDHETVWGLGMGSQIRREKIFWFGALDGYRRNDPGLATVKHPIGTNQYGDCAGFFCPPSVPQTELLSAQLGSGESYNQAYNDYLGVPRAGFAPAGLEQLAALLGPAPRTAAQWVGFARVDWQAAERHRFTLEGTGADWNAPGGGLTQVEETYGNRSFGSSEASQEWLLARWEAYLTPNLLAVTQGSAGRAILAARPDPPSAFESGFLGNNWNVYGQLPQIAVDSANGFTIGNPSRFGQGSYPDERLYHGQEMLDWVHNRLLVRAGFELDHNADVTSMLRNQTGTYHYSHVANFISDALAFENFGPNPSGPKNGTIAWHNCDPSGKAWRASNGQLMGLGALPCYSYYSQTIGPSNWHLSTNDWAGYVTAQWQPNKLAVFSAGLRWEREQLPPPIAELANSNLPLTEKLPSLGNNWGPRLSLAIGSAQGHLPVLRLGYGMYYGRTENATIETALTQTGSFNGDLNYFIRPTDGLNPSTITSGAPQFPDVLSGPPANVVTPGAAEFAPNFRNPEVHQAVAAIEQRLPGHIELAASAMLSLGRHLPVPMDANLGPLKSTETITYTVCDQTAKGANNTQCGQLGLGPIKATSITVPFYASWPFADCPSGSQLNFAGECGWINPNYQQITQIMSRANSTYEAAMVKITRYGRRGLSLHAHYTYAHAMDWNPNQSPARSRRFQPGVRHEQPRCAPLGSRHGHLCGALEAAQLCRTHRQRLDALRHWKVPQRPAVHHAHIRLASR